MRADHQLAPRSAPATAPEHVASRRRAHARRRRRARRAPRRAPSSAACSSCAVGGADRQRGNGPHRPPTRGAPIRPGAGWPAPPRRRSARPRRRRPRSRIASSGGRADCARPAPPCRAGETPASCSSVGPADVDDLAVDQRRAPERLEHVVGDRPRRRPPATARATSVTLVARESETARMHVGAGPCDACARHR